MEYPYFRKPSYTYRVPYSFPFPCIDLFLLRQGPCADAAAGARNWCPQELSVRQVFSHVLDIFGKPNRKFFETLSFFAKVRDAQGQGFETIS